MRGVTWKCGPWCSGVVVLPSWPAGKMCTLEYLPMVREVFEDSLRRAARALHTAVGSFSESSPRQGWGLL